MLMNVVNTSGMVLNLVETGGSGNSADAQGGNVLNALPYPFNACGPVAVGATKILPINPDDFSHKSVPWLPLAPSEEWRALVQKGYVTITFTAGGNDAEADAIHAG